MPPSPPPTAPPASVDRHRPHLTELRAVATGAVGTARRTVHRWWYARHQRRDVHAYLATAATPRLHLGAGHHHIDGWLNTDRNPAAGAVYLDVARPFPLPDASCAYVFSEHLIEHLPYEAAQVMLRECHRVLVPGGGLRVATPDLATIVGLRTAAGGGVAERYATWLADSYFPERHGPAAAFAINKVVRGWGHRFVYDEPTLTACLEAAGFTAVARHPFGHSDDPSLRGLEDHGVPDGNADLSAFETMVLEARRP